MRLVFRLVFVLAAAFAVRTSTEAIQAPPANGGRPVTLSVVAYDSHGQAVRDLKADDFQLTDQDKPQTITSFRLSQRNLGTTVILFDLLNENLGNRAATKLSLIRTLSHFEMSDSVYLYILANSGALYPIHPLPSGDAEPGTTPWTAGIATSLDKAMSELARMRPVDETQPGVRVEATLQVLDKLASTMESFPGRKSLVWITEGLPVAIRTVTDEIHDFSDEFAEHAVSYDRLGITVYPVAQDPDSNSGNSIRPLEDFANLTGGEIYHAGLEKALPDALTASRTNYVVQYAAPPADGQYHRIRLKCLRKGVKIQTKQGYYNTRVPGYFPAVHGSVKSVVAGELLEMSKMEPVE